MFEKSKARSPRGRLLGLKLGVIIKSRYGAANWHFRKAAPALKTDTIVFLPPVTKRMGNGFHLWVSRGCWTRTSLAELCFR